MIWEQLSRQQMEQVDRSIPVLYNIAAIEQHGHKLPLGSDAFIGEGLCSSIETSIPQDIILLPTQRIGYSEHHMEYSGTLTLSHETMISIIMDTVSSVYRHGFKKIFILNSHGGNQGALRVAMEKLGLKYKDLVIAGASWWTLNPTALRDLNEGGKGSTGHAGEFEHSLVEFFQGNLIHKEAHDESMNIQDVFPSWATNDLLHSAEASIIYSFSEMTKNGVYGDPAYATATKGKQINDLVTKKMITILNNIKNINR